MMWMDCREHCSWSYPVVLIPTLHVVWVSFGEHGIGVYRRNKYLDILIIANGYGLPHGGRKSTRYLQIQGAWGYRRIPRIPSWGYLILPTCPHLLLISLLTLLSKRVKASVCSHDQWNVILFNQLSYLFLASSGHPQRSESVLIVICSSPSW